MPAPDAECRILAYRCMAFPVSFQACKVPCASFGFIAFNTPNNREEVTWIFPLSNDGCKLLNPVRRKRRVYLVSGWRTSFKHFTQQKCQREAVEAISHCKGFFLYTLPPPSSNESIHFGCQAFHSDILSDVLHTNTFYVQGDCKGFNLSKARVRSLMLESPYVNRRACVRCMAWWQLSQLCPCIKNP